MITHELDGELEERLLNKLLFIANEKMREDVVWALKDEFVHLQNKIDDLEYENEEYENEVKSLTERIEELELESGY